MNTENIMEHLAEEKEKLIRCAALNAQLDEIADGLYIETDEGFTDKTVFNAVYKTLRAMNLLGYTIHNYNKPAILSKKDNVELAYKAMVGFTHTKVVMYIDGLTALIPICEQVKAIMVEGWSDFSDGDEKKHDEKSTTKKCSCLANVDSTLRCICYDSETEEYFNDVHTQQVNPSLPDDRFNKLATKVGKSIGRSIKNIRSSYGTPTKVLFIMFVAYISLVVLTKICSIRS